MVLGSSRPVHYVYTNIYKNIMVTFAIKQFKFRLVKGTEYCREDENKLESYIEHFLVHIHISKLSHQHKKKP